MSFTLHVFFRETKANPLFKAIPRISLNKIEHACNSRAVFYFSGPNFQKGMIYDSKYKSIFPVYCQNSTWESQDVNKK